MNFKLGFGYDVHRLEEGETLILGNVEIKHYKGTIAHSDGDVIIHAICDALLGAAGLRDIGYHFPDNNPEYKNIKSTELLLKVYNLLANKEYKIGNIDITICLEHPKIKEYIPLMKKNLSEILNIKQEDISIKATTNEGLGYIGQEQGVCAYAVALIYK